MARNEKIELVSSKESPTGVAGRRVDGEFTQNVAPIKPITPDSISGETIPAVVPEVIPSTGAAGLLGELEAGAKQVDTFTAGLQKEADVAETAKATSLEAEIKALSEFRGEAELTAEEAARKGGQDEIQIELNRINQDLLREQRGLEKQLRALDENPEGLFGGALQAEKRRVESESLERQADLSIIQMGIQGRFDSAKAIADRAVQVKLEQQKTQLSVLDLIYQDNKDQFTLKEQRAFESAQSDRQRTLDNTEAEAQEISDLSLTAMQNGAPSAVVRAIRGAKTIDEAIGAMGAYGTDPLEREAQRLANEKEAQEKDGLRGGVSPITGKPYTEGQLNAGTFASRMNQAEDILSGGRGKFIPHLPSFLKSEDRRLFEQAEKNFITAQLRKESGAAISPEEFVTAREVYIPVTTDSQEVLEAKARSREIATQGMENSSVGAFDALEASLSDTLFSPDEQAEFETIFSGGTDDTLLDFDASQFYGI